MLAAVVSEARELVPASTGDIVRYNFVSYDYWWPEGGCRAPCFCDATLKSSYQGSSPYLGGPAPYGKSLGIYVQLDERHCGFEAQLTVYDSAGNSDTSQ